MSAISEIINKVLGREGNERIPTPYWDDEESKMSDPIFSELLSIINSQELITESELADIHALVLDDQICNLIWEDSYPFSETNSDHEKDIGCLAITTIFHRFRPPEQEIIAKKDSKDPGARLFCIWMCTHEPRSDTNYDAVVELLFDDYGGVGNIALAGLGEVVSSHLILYQAIKNFLDPRLKGARNIFTVQWIYEVLNDIVYAIGEEGILDPESVNWGVLYDTDWHILGGENWAKTVSSLLSDHEWLGRIKTALDENSSAQYKCKSEICNNHFWIEDFVYSRRCAKCHLHHCDECLNDERVCKSCMNIDLTSEE